MSEYKYYCLFKVTGYDHFGDCSGEEEGDGTKVDDLVKKYREKCHPVKSLNDLDYEEEGCSSYRNNYGSGYCNGNMHQKYTAIKILDIFFDNVPISEECVKEEKEEKEDDEIEYFRKIKDQKDENSDCQYTSDCQCENCTYGKDFCWCYKCKKEYISNINRNGKNRL